MKQITQIFLEGEGLTLRASNHQVELAEDSINITYGFLDQTFKILDEVDISIKQIIACLATLSKKRKWYCQHC